MLSAIAVDLMQVVPDQAEIHPPTLSHLITSDSRITANIVMACATTDALLNDKDFAETFLAWGRRYPNVVYDPDTEFWLQQNDMNYIHQGYCAGAARRAATIGFLDIGIDELFDLAEQSAKPTHNHQEAIEGAKAVVYAIWALRSVVASKQDIYKYLLKEFKYVMQLYTHKGIRHDLDKSAAMDTVPFAIFLALESKCWVDAIQSCFKYVYRGDMDCILFLVSSIAFAMHGSSDKALEDKAKFWLFKNAQPILQVTREFSAKRTLLKLPF